MPTIEELISKYNQSMPRYTSYPTVPYWDEWTESQPWANRFREEFRQQNRVKGIALYIHLPFCESLCTYCACNKKITTNHSVEQEYIAALLQEWGIYCGLMDEKPVISELHLGGGTPTFFSPANLHYLLENLFKRSVIPRQPEFSIEGHPNNTQRAHLSALHALGFRRISYGVQDNDPVVQQAINRIQPVENLKRATDAARELGFTSVNYDLIYGLPFQTLQGERDTMESVIALQPDRIAFYSYAHVPWKVKAQRLFDENDLPSPALKTRLYLEGRQMLSNAGYHDIGMDHFSLSHDTLYQSYLNGTLHRNFMGYTTTHTPVLLGLGVSAISDTGNAYAQNHRELENYYRAIRSGNLAVTKGCFLDETDQVMKQYILDIACKGKTILAPAHLPLLQPYTLPLLSQLEADGIVTIRKNEVLLNPDKSQLLRVVCQAFDLKWHEGQPASKHKELFSKSI